MNLEDGEHIIPQLSDYVYKMSPIMRYSEQFLFSILYIYFKLQRADIYITVNSPLSGMYWECYVLVILYNILAAQKKLMGAQFSLDFETFLVFYILLFSVSGSKQYIFTSVLVWKSS